MAELGIPDDVGVSVDLHSGSAARIHCESMRRALINVVDNAVQAMNEAQSSGGLGGSKRLEFSSMLVDAGETIAFVVEDNGPGIPDEVRPKVERTRSEPVAKTSVLVVDDNADFADSLADLLGEFGYQVTTAYDGEAAILRIGNAPFDVALLDLNLPKASGIGVLRAVRARSPATEVFLITGVDAATLAREAPSSLNVSVLRKPIDASVLLARLATIQR